MEAKQFTTHRKEFLKKVEALDKRIDALRKERKQFSDELAAWDKALRLED